MLSWRLLERYNLLTAYLLPRSDTHIIMSQIRHRSKGRAKPGTADMSEESDIMLQHMLGGRPTERGRKQPASAAEMFDLQQLPSDPFTDTPDDSPVRAIFKQLAHSLTVLSSAADLMLANKSSGSPPQSLHVWLRPNARQAEEAMHSLREMRLGPSHAMTELSQCLTILVLAADMLSAGQLSEADAHECYELLRRNANRAVSGLYELHAQINTDTAE
jgi:hypothetical protein